MQNRNGNLLQRAIGYIFGQSNQPQITDQDTLEVIAAISTKQFKERLKWIYFNENDLSKDEYEEYETYTDEIIGMSIMTIPVILDENTKFKMDLYALEEYWSKEIADPQNPSQKITPYKGLNPATREPYKSLEIDKALIPKIKKFVEIQEERAVKREIDRKEKIRQLELELEKKLAWIETEKKSLAEERKQFEAEKAQLQLQLKEKLPKNCAAKAAPDPDDIINFDEEPSEPMDGSWVVLPDINGIASPGIQRNPSPATTSFFSLHRQFTMGLPYMMLFAPANRRPNVAASNNNSNNAEPKSSSQPNNNGQPGR